MKKGLIIAAVVLSALLLAGLIAPSLFDWNTQKERIETAATDALGQPVRLKGEISLSLVPTPRFTAAGLTVGAPETLAQGPYVSAGLIDVRVAFLPLLSGTIEAGKVVLRDAEIVLLTGQEQTADDTAPNTQAEQAPDIALPSVEIDNAKITLIDAKTGSEITLSEIDLAVTASSVTGPFSVDGRVLYGDLPISLSVQTADISGKDVPFEMRFVASENADLSLTLTGSAGDILGDTPRVDATLDIQTPDTGRALEAITGKLNPGLAGKSLDVSSPVSFENSTLYLADVKLNLDRLKVSGEVAARTHLQPMKVTAKFSADTLDTASFLTPADPNAPLASAIEIDLPQDIDAVVNIAIDTITGMPVEVSRLQVNTRLNAGKLDITQASAFLPGGVSAQGVGRFQSTNGILIGNVRAQAKGANAQPLMERVMAPGAAMPAGPIALDITMDAFVEQTGLRIGALVGQLGPMQLSASGKLDYGPKPTLDLRANINDLNADDWISDTPAAPSQTQDTHPFDGQVKFDLGIERLRRSEQIFEDIRLQGVFSNDRLTLETARIGDLKSALAEVSGTITDALSDMPKLDLQFKARAVSANTLLALGGLEPIEAAANAGAVRLDGTVEGSVSEPRVNARGTFGELSIKADARMKGADADNPTTTGNAAITIPNFAAWLSSMDMLAPSNVSASAQPVTLVTSFDSSVAGTSAQIDIKAAKGLAKIVYGQEGGTFRIDAGAAAPSMTDYIHALGFVFDPAGAQLGGLDIAMVMAGPLNALTLNTLKADIGPANLTGTGKLDLSGDVALVDLRLAGKNLDLAELLPEADTGAQAAASGSGERWSKEPLDLAMLAAVDGAVTLDLDRLTLREYELKDARLALGSEGKGLRVALERGDLFEGPATLAVTIDGSETPKMTAEVSVKNGNIAAATQSSAAIEPLTGMFDLNGSFSGRGASEYAIVQSLQGRASFSARDGVINGVDIVRLNERFGSLSTVNDFLRIIGSALKGGQTAYRLIALDAVASNGILSTQNMQTDIDGGAKASLDTRIDLPKWHVNGTGSFSLEDHPAAPPVGVAVSGPLDNATVTYETKKMQEYIGVRLGAAVLKGVVKGEGFGLKDLLGGGSQTQDADTGSAASTADRATDWSAPNNAAQTDAQTTAEDEEKKKPEEEIRDLILEGLFGRKKR